MREAPSCRRRLRAAPGGATHFFRLPSLVRLCLFLAPILGASSLSAQGSEDLASEGAPTSEERPFDPFGLDDEIVIIDDDGPAAGADPFGGVDEIIIIEEGDALAPASEPPITGALGRLWEAWHVAADSRAETLVQRVAPEDGVLRAWASLALETSLLPAPNLSFYANGFGRVFLDATPLGGELSSHADLYEAYAKINAEVGSVQLGRLIVPYGKTQVAALGDRLNPPDHRRGWALFPDVAEARQPQWGAWVRTSLGALALDGVLLLVHEPTEGSLAASEQGGVRIGRYQTALARSPARVGGLLDFSRRERLLANQPLSERTSLGVRARRRLGDFDLGATFVWAPDDVPTLRLPREASLALGREALTEMGMAPPLTGDPCPGASGPIACLGGEGALSHLPTGSVAADVTWGLGIVILRGELLVQPRVGVFPGKTALLIDRENGLISTRLGHFAAGVAVEGGLGDLITGSIEVFDAVWVDVPRGANLYGVERIDPVLDEPHTVHRLAVGASLYGTAFERLSWRLRGEGGVLQQDVLLGLELRYRLPVLNLYVGTHGAVFAGVPGSPGWLRQDATQIAIFVGEGA